MMELRKSFLLKAKRLTLYKRLYWMKDQSGLRLVQCSSLFFEFFLTAGIEKTMPSIYSKDHVPVYP